MGVTLRIRSLKPIYRNFEGPSSRLKIKGDNKTDGLPARSCIVSTSKATRAFFSSIGLTVLPWPANSSDLNPIENIWSVLKQNVEKRAAKTKDELVRVVLEEWDRIDMGIIAKTIETMKKRIGQVIERDGGKCDY